MSLVDCRTHFFMCFKIIYTFLIRKKQLNFFKPNCDFFTKIQKNIMFLEKNKYLQ